MAQNPWELVSEEKYDPWAVVSEEKYGAEAPFSYRDSFANFPGGDAPILSPEEGLTPPPEPAATPPKRAAAAPVDNRPIRDKAELYGALDDAIASGASDKQVNEALARNGLNPADFRAWYEKKEGIAPTATPYPEPSRVRESAQPAPTPTTGEIKPITQPEPSIGSILSGAGRAVATGLQDAKSGLRVAAGDILGDTGTVKQASKDIRQNQLETEMATPKFDSETARGAYGGITSLAMNLPPLVAGIATGNPEVALMGMVGPQALAKYGEYRADGVEPMKAALSAFGYSAVEYVTEKIPMGQLFKDFGKVGFAKMLFNNAVREIPGEQLATILQDAIDQATLHPEKTWAEYLQERPGSAYQTLVATVVQTGVTSAGLSAAGRLASRMPGPKGAEGAIAQDLSGLNIEEAFAGELNRAVDGGSFAPLDRPDGQAAGMPQSLFSPTSSAADAIASAARAGRSATVVESGASREAGLTPLIVPEAAPSVNIGSAAPEMRGEPGPAGQPAPQVAENPAVADNPLENASDSELLAGVPAFGAPVASAGAPETPAPGPNSTQMAATQWLGRKGNGYVTEDDAEKALPGREKRNPELEWRVERMPDGMYRLAGYDKTATPAAAQPRGSVLTPGMGQIASQPAQAATAPPAPPQQALVGEPSAAVGAQPAQQAPVPAGVRPLSVLKTTFSTPAAAQAAIAPLSTSQPAVEWRVEPVAGGQFRAAGYLKAEIGNASQRSAPNQADVPQGPSAPQQPAVQAGGVGTTQEVGAADAAQVPAQGVGGDAAQAAGGAEQSPAPVPPPRATPEQQVKTLARVNRDPLVRSIGGVRAIPAPAQETQWASDVASIFGRSVVFVEAKDPEQQVPFQGLVDPETNVIVLDKKTDDAPVSIAMHEVGHLLPPDIRKKLVDQIIPLTKNKAKFIADRPLYKHLDEAKQNEELAMFLVQGVARQKRFWSDLASELGDSDFARVAKIVLGKLDELIAGFKARGYSKHATDLSAIRGHAVQAYAEALRRQGDSAAAKQIVERQAQIEGGLSAESRAGSPVAESQAPGRSADGEGGVATAQEAGVPQDGAPLTEEERAALQDELSAELGQEPDGGVDYAAREFKMNIQRQARTVGEGSLSAEEVSAVERDAEASGLDPQEWIKKAQSTKSLYPEEDGWAPTEVVGLDIPKDPDGNPGKPEVAFKIIPYGFASPPGVEKAPSKIDQSWAERLAERMASAIRDVHARAAAGDSNAQVIVQHETWYRNMAAILRREFGGAGDLFADLLGATSPNTPVMTNWRFSVEILRRFSRGEFSKEMKAAEKWVLKGKSLRDLPEAKKLRQISGKLYGMNSTNSMIALLNLWRNIEPGSAPKARNFALNLIGQSNMATIDVWAARMLRRMANVASPGDYLRIPPVAEKAVTGKWNASGTAVTGEFGFGARVMERAVEMLKADGIEMTPPDLQAVAWFTEKELWGRQSWTTKTGEGGSFEEEVAETNPMRLVAGWTVATQGNDPSPVEMSVAQARLMAVLRGDTEVIAARAMPTFGLYGGSVERSFDTEIVAGQGFDPERMIATIARIAQENKQYDVFVSKVLDTRKENQNARPGMEVYFRDEKSLEAAKPIMDQLINSGIDGFTMVVDPRTSDSSAPGRVAGKFIGVRIQYIPEISLRWADESDPLVAASKSGDQVQINAVLADQFKKMARAVRQLQKSDLVAHAAVRWYDTLVIGKEDYSDYTSRLQQKNARRAGGGVGFGRPLREVLARASALRRGDGRADVAAGLRDGDVAADPAGIQFAARDAGPAESADRPGGGRLEGAQRGVEDARGWSKRSPRPEAVSVDAWHYGKERVPALSGSMYGSGIRGAERDRVSASRDPRTKRRVYFYIQKSDGSLPGKEAGLGPHRYEARLGNLYDASKGDARIPAATTENFESAVLDAGYDGYVARSLGMAVVLDADVPARYVGERANAPIRTPGPAPQARLKKALLSREIPTAEQIANNIPGVIVRNGVMEIEPGMKDQVNEVLAAADIGIRFAAREKPAPKKTVKAYKLFRVDSGQPGRLFPLFIGARDPVEAGVWYDADMIPTKGFAVRPGWHAGDLPMATHIGEKSDKAKKAPDRRPRNQVWAEVELPADVDWQAEADKRGTSAAGKRIPVKSDIKDQIPEDGFYRYKTNPSMTGNWLIGGSMKVNRILSDDEVKAINDAAGVQDLPRSEPIDLARFGFAARDEMPRRISLFEIDSDNYESAEDPEYSMSRNVGIWVAQAPGDRSFSSESRPTASRWLTQVFNQDEAERTGTDLLDGKTGEAARNAARGFKALAKMPGAFALKTPRESETDPFAIFSEMTRKHVEFVDVLDRPADADTDLSQYQVAYRVPTANGKLRRVTADLYPKLDREGNVIPKAYYADTSGMGETGIGAEFYQAAFVWARRNGIKLMPDDVLTWINTFRRTEQMLSAALRLGTTKYMEPHYDQRIHGWNSDPKSPAEDGENIARLVAATARNLTEKLTSVKGWVYNPLNNSFADDNGQRIEESEVAQVLSSEDAREAGIGRSTLARGLLARALMEGKVRPDQLGPGVLRPLVAGGLDTGRPEGGREADQVDAPGGDRGGTEVAGLAAPIFYATRQTPPPGGVSASGARFTLPEETKLDVVRRKTQDAFLRMKRVQDTIVSQGGRVTAKSDVYTKEELAPGRKQALMDDFRDEDIAPLLDRAAAAGISLDELALYAYAKHAPERNAAMQEKNPNVFTGSGISDEAASTIADEIESGPKSQQYRDLHRDLLRIAKKTRRKLVDYGLITDEQFIAMENQYENWVPLRGFGEVENDVIIPGEQPDVAKRRGGRGINVRGKETIRALGRDSLAAGVIENVIGDYERAISRGEDNIVARAFLKLAQDNPDPSLWEINPRTTQRTIDPDTGQVEARQVIDTGEETIGVKVAGQQVFIRIKDPLLLRAMRQTYRDGHAHHLARAMHEVGIDEYTNWLRRVLTQWNPTFVLPNTARDAQAGAAGVLQHLGAEGVARFSKAYPAAYAAAWRHERNGQGGTRWDKVYDEFRRSGGVTGAFFGRDEQTIREDMQALIAAAGGKSSSRLANVRGSAPVRFAGTFFTLVEDLGTASENATRAAAYKVARDMGKSKDEAASIAKNLTTNFNRKGEWGPALNGLYLFYNASVQGSVRTLQALSSPKVATTMAAFTALTLALALANADWGGEDDDGEKFWDKIPDFEKERNLILMLPPGDDFDGAEKIGKHGRYIKLPLPYGFNVFTVLGYNLADVGRHIASGGKEGLSAGKGGMRVASAAIGSFNPFGGAIDFTNKDELWLAALPTVADAVYQLSGEVSSWGRPVAPRKYNEALPDSQRFNARQAGGAAQRVADFAYRQTVERPYLPTIDITPGTIENVAGIAGGGLGRFAYDVAVNIPTKLWSNEEIKPREVPFWRNVQGEVDATADVSRAYERAFEVKGGAASLKKKMELGVSVDMTDPDNANLLDLEGAAKNYTKAMSKLKKEEISVMTDDTLTDAEKRAQRKRIHFDQKQEAQAFNIDYLRVTRNKK